MIVSRAYNSFTINSIQGTITKVSSENRLGDEINYYKSLPQSTSIFFPRVVNSQVTDEANVLELEYYTYSTLGEILLHEKFDKKLWENIVLTLNDTLNNFSQTFTTGDFSDFARAMYLTKTEHYYNELVTNFEKFSTISKHKYLTLNGVKYLNFNHIWENIKNVINNKLISLKTLNIIHGDFCFSNIMYGFNPRTNTSVIKCIDPRGSFGNKGIYGDPLYDVAKLMHSYEGGYEYFINDKFFYTQNPELNKFNLAFDNNNLYEAKKIFEQYSLFTSPLPKLIQGLIFIGMCSRHYDSEDRQTVMYLTGIKLLNEILNEQL